MKWTPARPDGISTPARGNEENVNFLTKEMLTNIMRTWNAKICQTFVALVKGNQQPPAGFLSELVLLEKQGLLTRDADNNWQVSARALVDFINNKTEQELCKQ